MGNGWVSNPINLWTCAFQSDFSWKVDVIHLGGASFFFGERDVLKKEFWRSCPRSLDSSYESSVKMTGWSFAGSDMASWRWSILLCCQEFECLWRKSSIIHTWRVLVVGYIYPKFNNSPPDKWVFGRRSGFPFCFANFSNSFLLLNFGEGYLSETCFQQLGVSENSGFSPHIIHF